MYSFDVMTSLLKEGCHDFSISWALPVKKKKNIITMSW
jgi:hypothetical protein